MYYIKKKKQDPDRDPARHLHWKNAYEGSEEEAKYQESPENPLEPGVLVLIPLYTPPQVEGSVSAHLCNHLTTYLPLIVWEPENTISPIFRDEQPL